MHTFRIGLVVLSCGLAGLVAACGGSPCGAYVEATAKWGPEQEKKMATDMKDQFVKACEMGMKGNDDMSKAQAELVECIGKAGDQAAYDACRKAM